MAITFTQSNANVYRNVLLRTTGASIKESAGVILGWSIITESATAEFVKFYNISSTTSPTSTGTPALTVGVTNLSPSHISLPGGIEFNTGIGIRAATGSSDASNGNPAGAVVANVFYV
jgi:hypothetical protein